MSDKIDEQTCSEAIVVSNKLGLHARASAKLVQTAGKFRSEITILMTEKNKQANAKSIMGVMMLGASKSTAISITTKGEDAEDALHAVVELFNNKFGEGE